jgi:hypothetical protein
VDTLGFRFATQESPGFETGCSTCGNFAYKLFLVGIGRSIGFPNTASGRFGLYLQGPASAHTMGAEMNDRNPDNLGYAGHDEIVRYAMGPASGWTGTWNTWLVRIAFTDASTAPLSLFRNGRQIATILTNWYRTSLNGRALVDIELGSTLNSGPSVPQQRWWREVGIYRTRPSVGAKATRTSCVHVRTPRRVEGCAAHDHRGNEWRQCTDRSYSMITVTLCADSEKCRSPASLTSHVLPRATAPLEVLHCVRRTGSACPSSVMV